MSTLLEAAVDESNRGTILICEDEAIVSAELKQQLSKNGYTVVGVASTGEAAIDIAEKEHPDLALMDIMIDGDMDGTDVAKILRDKFEISTVFLTAYSDKSTFESAKLSNPLGFLLKPVRQADLMRALELAMQVHQERQMAKKELGQLGKSYRARLQEPSNSDKPNFDESIVHVLGGFAHTLNNSLRSLSVNLDWLLNCNTLYGYERGYVERAYKSCEECANTIQKMLWTSQQGIYQFKDAEIEELLDEVINSVKPQLRGNIEIKREKAKDKKYALVNQESIEQALRALIINADESMLDSGEISIKADIVHCDDAQSRNPNAKPGNYIEIQIHDEGQGISKADLPNVVKPFYSTKDTDFVRGLGLSVASGVAQRHGGWILIDSKINSGTTVRMFLPALARS